jgi:hypothetical protein
MTTPPDRGDQPTTGTGLDLNAVGRIVAQIHAGLADRAAATVVGPDVTIRRAGSPLIRASVATPEIRPAGTTTRKLLIPGRIAGIKADGD